MPLDIEEGDVHFVTIKQKAKIKRDQMAKKKKAKKKVKKAKKKRK